MKNSSLYNTLVSSAENYYNYVDNKKLSIITLKVQAVSYNKAENILQLKMEKKSDKLEMSYFMIKGREFTSDQIEFVEYDSDTATVKVRPLEEFLPSILPLSPDDISIIIDLKYLIKRVYQWHKDNANKLALPKSVPLIKPSLIVSNIQKPSAIQSKAIEHIFSTPFSYIWGAPGTGKTSVVLAHSVLQYMKQMPAGRKILLCAPTNNALEQSLYSILPLLKANNVPLSKVRRLGMPSKHFREKYPMCCEIQDNISESLQNELEQIKTQLYICNTYKYVHDLLALRSILTALIPIKEQTIKLAAKYIEIEKLVSSLKNEISIMNEDISSIDSQIFILSHKQYSFWTKYFNKRKLRADRNLINSLSARQKNIHAKVHEYTLKLSSSNSLLEETHNAYIEQSKLLDHIVEEIKASYSNLSKIGKAIAAFNSDEIVNLSQRLDLLLSEYQKYLFDHGQDYQDDLKYDHQYLLKRKDIVESEIEKHKAERELNSHHISLEACTIDKFCALYSDNGFLPRPMHIFLDEAGYANLCKTLCLFGMDCPVTFLGDHMQLPPVFEVSNSRDLLLPEMANTFLWDMSALHVETFFSMSPEALWEVYKSNTPPPFNVMNKVDLTETYRFSKSLTDILDKHIYHNGFSSLSNRSTEIISLNAKTGAHRDRFNDIEIDAIEEYLKENSHEDFVILTPYKKQVDRLAKRFPDLAANDKILTVHKSQGREWETVIFSVVDTTNLWFTDSNLSISKGKEVLNTAISRAQNKLVIVCDVNIWEQKPSQIIADLIKSHH